MKIKILVIVILLLAFAAFPSMSYSNDEMPDTFIDIEKVIPDALLDIRYFTDHNFLGVKVDGYLAPKCLLTRQAAQALANVQKDLAPFAMTIKIYDCYRPQRAVDHFVRWAKDIADVKTQKEFYPTLDKRNLFRDGYIAKRSGHSRGSTVDLTIVSLPASLQPSFDAEKPLKACYLPAGVRFADNSLDMGTGFDCFHELSHPENMNLGPQHRANRLLLKTLMAKYGFRNLPEEWWHFTLNSEPYPDTYFNFPVK
ncbi:MAG TPA: M15 family metallopeptidase [Smithellaceae bacterium]|jgi:zinc D-Ala-D-Ala dipeptidase|nr:M15 family metallopeptidase [Smithellaceae bacterium]HQM45817.1 M15 family metallopeptidase [Smithellaceae bacterium]